MTMYPTRDYGPRPEDIEGGWPSASERRDAKRLQRKKILADRARRAGGA